MFACHLQLKNWALVLMVENAFIVTSNKSYTVASTKVVRAAKRSNVTLGNAGVTNTHYSSSW